MAKGQKRSNREAKKPKAKKPAAPVEPSSFIKPVVSSGGHAKKY